MLDGVPDAQSDRAREAFVAVWACVREESRGFTIARDGFGPVEGLFAPAYFTSVQRIGTIVGVEGVVFAVQVDDFRAADPVAHSPNSLAEVGRVVPAE